MKNNINIHFMNGILVKVFVCNLIILLLIFCCNANICLKEKIYFYIYEDNIDFSVFKNIYNKYLGGVFSFKVDNNTRYVFDEQISYSNVVDYYDGAKLDVLDNYLVPIIREGIVVYIGEKDKYGSVVIVEDNVGVYNWYGNICNVSLKIYDHVGEGDYIGQSCQNYIYLVFSKDNNFFDYNNFID